MCIMSLCPDSFPAPFRFDLPTTKTSSATPSAGAKLVTLDTTSSQPLPHVYEYKTIRREVYENALKRTSEFESDVMFFGCR